MLVIFDLDGVLIDSKEIHFRTLNKAIETVTGTDRYIITPHEHVKEYDGLSTKEKLSMLVERKGLPNHHCPAIWKAKQELTKKEIKSLRTTPEILKLLRQLKERDIHVAVASNSIRETLWRALVSTKIIEYVDFLVSNQDVRHPKPHPEMYWKCMVEYGEHPGSTIIVEDSPVGRSGALASGAHLFPVESPKDLTADALLATIDRLEKPRQKWSNKKLNVLIPMAGAGSRFAAAGYTFPKPLIEVDGKPMIQAVVENLNLDAHYIFLAQAEHIDKYNLKQVLGLIAPGCDIVPVDGLTEGAACTTLLAADLIDNDNPLLIANSDQIVEWDSAETMYAWSNAHIDGAILTFKSTHPKWSFAKVAEDGVVQEVAEKNPISDNATVGIYYWKRGSDYVKYARQMIDYGVRYNNEFYVAPVFNEAIADNKIIRTREVEKMWGIGTPEDLRYYLENR